MTQNPIIVWFRQDLRLSDNPALHEAAKTGAPILPLYILDDENAGEWKMGGASRVWLHHSLTALNESLSGHLHIAFGDAKDIIPALTKKHNAKAVYWNRCYEPWRVTRDKHIKQSLKDANIKAESFNASLLWEPWDIAKGDGTPYKVFTPFYKNGCLGNGVDPRAPLPAPKNIVFTKTDNAVTIESLNLLPAAPRWDKSMVKHWDISETGAQTRLHDFLDEDVMDYKEGRDYMAKTNISRLSTYLHFGEISPHQIWHATKFKSHSRHSTANEDAFLRELVWREFNYHLLYHFPAIPRKNFQPRFDAFPWRKDAKALKAWQTGQTGYPIVDAAMRELWQTGYMHNRARLIVGSFLAKHLLLYWHDGEDWFWDCLFDADLANNACNWQWIAGTGADAAPYFRIFNPVTQGEKFDPAGAYVRRYVPELACLPDKYIHAPWTAPEGVLKEAGVTLGKTYPHPIVDHSAARTRALEAFGKTKDSL